MNLPQRILFSSLNSANDKTDLFVCFKNETGLS